MLKDKIKTKICPICGKENDLENLCYYCKQKYDNLKFKITYAEEIEKIFKNKNDYIIIAIDTTGYQSDDLITEMSIITLSGEILFNNKIRALDYMQLIKYNKYNSVNPEIMNRQPFLDAWNTKIKKNIENKTVIFYNSAFLKDMMYSHLNRNYLKPVTYKTFCLMVYHSKLNYDFRWKKFSEAINYVEVDTKELKDKGYTGTLLIAFQKLAYIKKTIEHLNTYRIKIKELEKYIK